MFDPISQNSVLSTRLSLPALLASVTVHAMLAGLLIVLPLVVFQRIPLNKSVFLIKIPDDLEAVIPKPPPVKDLSNPGMQNQANSTGYHGQVPLVDISLPDRNPTFLPPPSEDYFPGWIGMKLEGLPVGFSNKDIAWIPGAGFGPSTTVENPPPPVIPEPPDTVTPLRIGVLNPSKLLYRIPPVYPEMARKMHVSGTVKLEATINEEGNVSKVTIIEGHPLLRTAAIDAVKQWRFTPTIQNGEPIPIIATIKVNFKIQQ